VADYGIKISKAGYDVKTAADKDLILTSKYPVLKVLMQGSGTVTVADDGGINNGTDTITHSLGYKPMCLLYCDTEAAGGDRAIVPARNYLFGSSAELTMDIGTNTVVLSVFDGPDEGEYDYYYYIFYDQSTA